MKKRILSIILVIFIIVLIACTNDNNNMLDTTTNPTETDAPNGQTSHGGEQPTETKPLEPQQEPEFAATGFMDKFIAGDMSGIYEMWSEETKPLVSEQLFAEMRFDGIERAGEFINYVLTETEQISAGEINGIRFRFTAQQKSAKVVYGIFIDSAGEVAGFSAVDIDFSETTVDFPYIVEEVVIGAGTKWALDGKITLPFEAAIDNPVPAVVLVHGSGPSDMNEASYGEKVFFDIADYLSANGIAVIRYDKRSFTHGALMVRELGGSATVWEETIEDAILAAKLLRADLRISSVYLLGHSLGGSLAPRIHAMGGDFDGLILFAGSPRTIQEISIEQYQAEIELMGDIPEMAGVREQVDSLIEIIEKIPNMADSTAKNTAVPMLNCAAYYLKDLAVHPFEEYVKDIAVPILVMQGRNDFQVRADVDYTLLQEMLKGNSNTFKLYDGLDHRFISSTATNFIEHRNQILTRVGARVEKQVLQDIVEWVLAQSK
ncbi:MAG: lysophospholipase [Oscillospiraceae bacterium]|nr:lysophospholipase [Oscillospiraceae bacterium]